MLATTAVGGIVVADDTSSAPPADAQSPSEIPTSSPTSTTGSDSSATAKGPETETTPSEPFPESIETIVYEETGDRSKEVTVVTKDTQFTMEPTVVKYSSENASVPGKFYFTPMMKISLNSTESDRRNISSDGSFKMEIPEDADPEPVSEFDPDVPVSNPPREIEYNEKAGTLTVVTSNETTDLAVASVTDNGTIEYQVE